MSASFSPARMHVRHEDGTEGEIGAGEAYVIEPGHDAWVVGDETFVGFEFETQGGRGVREGLEMIPSVDLGVGAIWLGGYVESGFDQEELRRRMLLRTPEHPRSRGYR